jgi:tetratricopeptide (TPR) repeat protein
MKRGSVVFVILVLILSGCNSELSREADRLLEQGDYKAAIAAYDEYLVTKPKDVKSLYNRGRAYEELGQIERAKADFITILDIDGNNVNANLSMGKYWYNREDYKQAINFFDKVIQVDNTEEPAYLLKGRSLHKMGKFKEAVQNYNVVIELNNKNADVYLYRGALRINLGQTKKGCDDLTRSRELGAEEASAAYNKYCKN